jgi:hypothetical protein
MRVDSHIYGESDRFPWKPRAAASGSPRRLRTLTRRVLKAFLSVVRIAIGDSYNSAVKENRNPRGQNRSRRESRAVASTLSPLNRISDARKSTPNRCGAHVVWSKDRSYL